ncbi:MAG: hypothetical protein DI535_07975 [Citrobacter freundii]|nr:MAG: hypothetical protein DI535_07975 [Citrobacter freundii]
MQFPMRIEWNRKIFRVMVTQVSHDRTREKFEIRGRNKTVTVESNKPWLEHKKSSQMDAGI